MAMSGFLAIYLFYYILNHGKPLADNELNSQDLSSRLRYMGHAAVVGSYSLSEPRLLNPRAGEGRRRPGYARLVGSVVLDSICRSFFENLF